MNNRPIPDPEKVKKTVREPDVCGMRSDSPSSIAERNAAVLALLDKWEAEGDEQEQTETWEFLQQSLDEDRLSSHRPFFP
jgi:hypothetical protein